MFEKATTEKIRGTESTTKESFNSRDFSLLNCYMVDIFTFFFLAIGMHKLTCNRKYLKILDNI